MSSLKLSYRHIMNLMGYFNHKTGFDDLFKTFTMTTYQTTVEKKLDIQETAKYTSRHKKEVLININGL